MSTAEVPRKNTEVRLYLYWIIVLIPFAYGVTESVLKSTSLFTKTPAAQVAPPAK